MTADEAHGIVRSVHITSWLPIETAPQHEHPSVMFVVVAIDRETTKYKKTNLYITDPCCVWRQSDGSFARWPHSFTPTHWFPLPDVQWTKIAAASK